MKYPCLSLTDEDSADEEGSEDSSEEEEEESEDSSEEEEEDSELEEESAETPAKAEREAEAKIKDVADRSVLCMSLSLIFVKVLSICCLQVRFNCGLTRQTGCGIIPLVALNSRALVHVGSVLWVQGNFGTCISYMMTSWTCTACKGQYPSSDSAAHQLFSCEMI